jgi:phospholipid-binding lipoprotein MlaA
VIAGALTLRAGGRAAARALALVATVLLAGCATTSMRGDPFEPANRVAFDVHEAIDGAIIRPAIQVYVDYTPEPVRRVVSNFFGNIDDLYSAINSALQGKPDDFGNSLGRVMVNTGFGLGGLIDIASEAGIPKVDEDFGQTFGVWGIPQGPYLFVPLFGPSTFRDGTGFLIRAFTTPTGFIPDIPVRNVVWGMAWVNENALIVGTSKLVEQAALDRYTFVRRAYLQRREYLVRDGKPAPETEDE